MIAKETLQTPDHSDGSGNDEPIPVTEDLIVAKQENRWVWRLRFFVAFVLLAATVAVCLAVYFDGRNDQQDDFEHEFEGLADKLVVSFESVVKQRFGAVDLFVADVSAHANNSWPYVTPPRYAPRVAEVHRLAGLFVSTICIRVTGDNRAKWEEYAVANQGWKRDGMAFLAGMDPKDVIARPISDTILDSDSVKDTFIPDAGPGPYMVSWMQHPAHNGSDVDNFYNDPEHHPNMDYIMANHKPAFGLSYDYVDESTRDMRYHLFKMISGGNYFGDPFVVAQFPVFDDERSKDRKVVAIFFTVLYWRTFFDGLLPRGADGIYVVMENTCGQAFTYQIDGLDAKFAGLGDLHSSEYDYLSKSTSITDIMAYGEGSNATIGDDPSCHYKITVYPSEQFQKSFDSNEPTIFASLLGLVFIFTSVVFLLYDCMVERRQKAVMKSAQQSGRLVQSLFPEDIRDRLYEEQEAATTAPTWKNQENAEQNGVQDKTAIATEYPETTVFFADLVGFTKWSSTRTPVEVFKLLEALYGAFDKIAVRYKVFKVETIGDCYVAVTGLPDPQEKHAELMVKFAVQCQSKMKDVVQSLVDSLGEDTSNLAMRIGLHSGPVTGGVLRGQKSRFQLFGDTVNTASRMESNGMSNMIHVSQSTADELIKRGRESWLEVRDRKLPVKGKGDMQTYFVQVKAMTITTGSEMRTSGHMSASLRSEEI